MKPTLRVVAGGAITFLAVGATLAAEPRTRGLEAPQRAEPAMRYRVTASKPRLNRRPMGEIQRWVQGVPAEPVDSMCWNGEGSVPIEGSFELDVDPVRNVGRVKAEWTDEHGEWTYTQKRFIHPDDHPSGARFGSSSREVETIINEGIAINVYLHGDTTAGQPVLPTVFSYIAAWGPATVTLNGEVFRSPYEIPAPQWLGHIMVTEGVRRPDGTVRTLTGEIYNPTRAREGAVEHGDIEAHLTWHDDAMPMTSNVPPLFSFFYHLVFEEVKIEFYQQEADEGADY